MRVEVVSEQPKRKPTRRDLLIIIGRCQNLFGVTAGIASNDRHMNRQARLQEACTTGFQLCVDARSYENAPEHSGPWADPGLQDRSWESAG